MAPSKTIVLAAALLGASTVSALPQGKVDSGMPFLESSATATVWWTPEATQSQNWNTWNAQSTAATVVAASSPVITSTAPYSNPFTIYTTMTDSRGVITGMPSVATSQPSQSAVATICSGCSSVLSDQASWSSMVGSLYSTSTTVAAVSTASASASSSANATASAQPSFSQSTGGASRSGIFSSAALLTFVGTLAALL